MKERNKNLGGTWSAGGPHSCRYPGMLQVCTDTQCLTLYMIQLDIISDGQFPCTAYPRIKSKIVKARPEATAGQEHSSCRGSWISSTTSPTAHRFFFGPLLFGSSGRSKIRQNSPQISSKEGEEWRYRFDVWTRKHGPGSTSFHRQDLASALDWLPTMLLCPCKEDESQKKAGR